MKVPTPLKHFFQVAFCSALFLYSSMGIFGAVVRKPVSPSDLLPLQGSLESWEVRDEEDSDGLYLRIKEHPHRFVVPLSEVDARAFSSSRKVGDPVTVRITPEGDEDAKVTTFLGYQRVSVVYDLTAGGVTYAKLTQAESWQWPLRIFSGLMSVVIAGFGLAFGADAGNMVLLRLRRKPPTSWFLS